MVIAIKLMTNILVNILVHEILLLFNANELHIYIFNGHQTIKHVSSVIFIPLLDMEVFQILVLCGGRGI